MKKKSDDLMIDQMVSQIVGMGVGNDYDDDAKECKQPQPVQQQQEDAYHFDLNQIDSLIHDGFSIEHVLFNQDSDESKDEMKDNNSVPSSPSNECSAVPTVHDDTQSNSTPLQE